MKIIRTSAQHFTQREWNTLVTSARMNPELNGENEAQASAGVNELEQPDLESPHRDSPAQRLTNERDSPLPPLTASPVPHVEPPGSWKEPARQPAFSFNDYETIGQFDSGSDGNVAL